MQSVTCLATDVCLTADPGVPSLIAARYHTFMEIDREIISTVISLPSEKQLSVLSESMRTKYWFDLIHYVPSTIFQLDRDGYSRVEPVLSWDKCVLLKGTIQCHRWGSNPRPLGLESSTLAPMTKYWLTASSRFPRKDVIR